MSKLKTDVYLSDTCVMYVIHAGLCNCCFHNIAVCNQHEWTNMLPVWLCCLFTKNWPRNIRCQLVVNLIWMTLILLLSHLTLQIKLKLIRRLTFYLKSLYWTLLTLHNAILAGNSRLLKHCPWLLFVIIRSFLLKSGNSLRTNILNKI